MSLAIAYATLALRALLGWIFLTSALDKLRSRVAFRDELEAFSWIPSWGITPLVVLIPLGELAVAANMLLGPYWRIAAAGSALLLVTFSVATFLKWQSGSASHCGCGGLVPTASADGAHLLVNGMLLAAAVGLAATSTTVAAVNVPWEVGLLRQERETGNPGLVYLIYAASLSSLITILAVHTLRSASMARRRRDSHIFGMVK